MQFQRQGRVAATELTHRAAELDVTRRVALIGLASGASLARAQSDDFTGFAGTTVRFASVEAGQRVLTADDEWLRATSVFQRRAVMQRAEPVTLDAFKQWNADAVRPWSDEQRARWRRALEALAPAFNTLRVPLPSEVLLIISNGQESANAPYTRANAVVLAGAGGMPGYNDAMLMAHELWHVASRHATALATRLYAEIGFEPVPQLDFPATWADIRIANPDAPENRHAMRLTLEGRETLLAPVLVAARTELKPGETFFDVLDVRLLEIEPAGERSRAVLRNGQPRWHPLATTTPFLTRLGGNTGYVIHPEEAMADNVMLLVNQRPARNPALIERLRAVFESQPR
jgi:hypothetical protein